VPEEGLDELTIEYILNTLAAMDSNNGINHIGIGEREGRVFSNIVKKRNFNLVHGMGR
jgi:O-phospho-L-seryl-tRNASec:L-selenocysteinyl-tRNA synthase